MDANLAISNINARLVEARDAYYKHAAPKMTDAEYDQLEKQLEALVKKHPEHAALATVLSTVGDDAGDNGRIRHLRPMLSIENKYSKDEIVDFFRSLPPSTVMLVEPKRDGISCELQYKDGVLVRALTRGDGASGEDMTAQVRALKTIPKTIDGKFFQQVSTLHFRGELVMRTVELERINKDLAARGEKLYMSTRNLAAGTMKQKDMAVVASREILFQPWDLYSPDRDNELPDEALARMDAAHKAGFPKYDGVAVSNVDAVLTQLEVILAKNAKSEVNADGVVAKVNSIKLRKALGVASKYTNYQVCFKPQSASGTTILRSIAWQMGRQGKLTPVATVDPVILAGAECRRATLNNETWIAAMGLKMGATVEMLRSGDVIPQIVKVLDDSNATDIIPPTTCPECHSKLEVYTDDGSSITTRWCENSECPGRVRDLFAYIGDREVLEIDGLGDEMANKLVKDNFAINVAELFEFQVECKNIITAKGEDTFLNAMQKKGFSVTILRMVNSMEKAKTANWERWIATLGIPMVSGSLGKVLAKELHLTGEDMAVLPARFLEVEKMTIEGMGKHKRDSLFNWARNAHNVDLCKRLHAAGVRPKSLVIASPTGAQPLKGTAFCITGEFGEDRESIAAKLVSLGATQKSGVSKNCSILIVGNAPGKSKLTKAKELSIKQVGAVWLKDTLKANGLELVGEANKFDYEEA